MLVLTSKTCTLRNTIKIASILDREKMLLELLQKTVLPNMERKLTCEFMSFSCILVYNDNLKIHSNFRNGRKSKLICFEGYSNKYTTLW